jgi:iron complex transport system ATP-binding protein
VAELVVKGLEAGYDGKKVLQGIDLTLPEGQVTAIIGPNACGKSTLMRCAARLLRPTAGGVYLDGEDVQAVPTRELAKRLGLLPQSPIAPDGIVVRELVARGRAPYRSWWSQWSSADGEAVERAISVAGVEDLADRPVSSLSGGQRQRVWVALILAQDPETFLLDEPTTYLDLSHQIALLDLVRGLAISDGRTIVMVLHDLNQACRFADHLVVMKDGRVAASGRPGEIVDPALLRDVFGLEASVGTDPVAGTPLIIPVASSAVPGAPPPLSAG